MRMSFDEAAKILHTNFRNCTSESQKVRRLSDKMRYLGDDGIWPLVDEKGNEWDVDANNVTDVTQMKELVPGYKSILDGEQ